MSARRHSHRREPGMLPRATFPLRARRAIYPFAMGDEAGQSHAGAEGGQGRIAT